MLNLPSDLSKRCSLAVLTSLLAFAPALAGADASPVDLRAGSGAPPTSLISSPSLGPSIGRLAYSGLVSLDIPPSGLSVGPRLAGEVMYGFMDLAPQLRLDLGGRVSYAYHSANDVFIAVANANATGSQWIIDVVPDAKLRYAINDQLGVYGDFGLGLAFMRDSVDFPAYSFGGTTFPPTSSSDSTVALTIQFGAGVAYAITPTINLLGEVRFDVYTRSGSGVFISIPTVGLEFH